MFEYIKRVSIATSFIAAKVDQDFQNIRNFLNVLSLELLEIAQNFRNDDFKVADLKRLLNKIYFLVDVVDYAKINEIISNMNANIFLESQINFLKHITNLIDQKNSSQFPFRYLKEVDENLARKLAKESIQNKTLANFANKYSFTTVPSEAPDSSYFEQTDIAIHEPENRKTEKVSERISEKVLVKKVLEESIITPQIEGSLESVEHEIDKRRARILKALVNGGGSIKEIAYKIKDVNEKTIQRDLLGLMHDKKVIMLGKKRWAKYYLK